jgi:hypothetical protein
MNITILPFNEGWQFDIWPELIDHWFAEKYLLNSPFEFVIVRPDNILDPRILAPSNDSRWSEISRAWYQIQKPYPQAVLQDWKVIYNFGEEIAPNLKVFRIKESNSTVLFWLTKEHDLIETQARLADLLPTLSAYWHIISGRGLFHAAGIQHKKNAYLFVGVSGSGKSTVSILSNALGDQVINDDHVVVSQGEKGNWLVSDSTYTNQRIPIKGIFFLVQDYTDYIFPIKRSKIVSGLLASLSEHANEVLIRNVLRQAFTICSKITRTIPCYELHFRKSSDFWKLIDAKFPDRS